MQSDSITKLVLKGVGYLTGQTFLIRTLLILRTAILARLLSPSDFGIIFLSLVLIQGLGSITSIGIDKILIQKQLLTKEIIGNAWTINIFRGLLITILTYILCPIYSSITHEPDSLFVLKIIALVPLIEGLINPGSFIAEREIHFKRITFYETISALSEIVVVIFLALVIHDVRALAWGMVGGYFLKAVLSFFFFRVPAFPQFKKSDMLELISVAKLFIIISIGSLLMIQGDKLLIGSLLGTKKLGYYVIAYQLAIFPIGILRKITNRVSFPLFSKLQNEKERLKETVSTILQIQLALLVPFIICVAFYADNIITMLYGEKWAESANVLKVLMMVTLGRGITIIAVPYIMGTGNFQFASKIKGAETFIFLIGVYFGITKFGLIGAAYGSGIGYMFAGIARLIYLIYKNNIPIKRILGFFLLPATAILPGGILGIEICKRFLWSKSVESALIVFIVFVSYITLSLFVQKEIVRIIKTYFALTFKSAFKEKLLNKR